MSATPGGNKVKKTYIGPKLWLNGNLLCPCFRTSWVCMHLILVLAVMSPSALAALRHVTGIGKSGSCRFFFFDSVFFLYSFEFFVRFLRCYFFALLEFKIYYKQACNSYRSLSIKLNFCPHCSFVPFHASGPLVTLCLFFLFCFVLPFSCCKVFFGRLGIFGIRCSVASAGVAAVSLLDLALLGLFLFADGCSVPCSFLPVLCLFPGVRFSQL